MTENIQMPYYVTIFGSAFYVVKAELSITYVLKVLLHSSASNHIQCMNQLTVNFSNPFVELYVLLTELQL